MENVIHRLTLDLTGPDTIPRVEVQQDNARSLSISLTQGGRPYWIAEGVTAVFSGRKPDGNPLFNACTVEKNRVRYDFTAQTTNVAGIVECEILLYSGDERILASPRFELAIDELIHRDGDVPESAPEIGVLDQMIAEGTAMLEDLQAVLEELGGLDDLLAQVRALAEAASNSEAAAKGHAKTAADAAADALGSAEDAEAHANAARKSEDNSRLNLHEAEVAAQNAEAAARRAEEAAANAGQGGSGGSGGAGSWDELAGKPTYVQTGPHTVVWEGAMDGERFVATSVTSDATYLKISNEIPSKAELAGAKLTHSSEVFDPGPIAAIADGTGCYGSEDYGILVVTQTGEIEDPFRRDGIAPGTGIYVQLEGYEGQDSPYLRLSYGEYSQEKFDPKWLPDGGFGWEGPGGKTDILPESELVMDEDTQIMPMPDGRTLYAYAFYPLPISEDLTEGEEYDVAIDGVAHRKICAAPGGDDDPMRVLGNLEIMGMGEDTGEDWVFFVQSTEHPNLPDADYWVGMFATTNTEYKTVAVSAEGTVVHQIEERFIPESIARKDDIKITWEAIPDKPFGVTVTSLAAPMTLAEMRYTGSYTYGMGFLPQRIAAGERYLVSVDGKITEWVAQQIPTGVYLGADPRAFNEPGTLPEGAYSIWQSSNSIMVYLIGDRIAPIIGVARVEVKYIDERVIPDSIARVGQIPSDAHIKDLIDEALGGIENGTY